MTCTKDKGKANATNPSDVTRIFNILDIKEDSIFCDLGCGNAKLCIKSISRVKEAIGFECDNKRYLTSKRSTAKYPNIKIFKGNYEHKRSIKKFRNADVIFCVNGTTTKFLKEIEMKVKKGTYFIQYYLPSCPIKPYHKLGWYYIMKTPFHYAKTEQDWVKSLQQGNLKNLKRKIYSYFKDGKERIDELEDELMECFAC